MPKPSMRPSGDKATHIPDTWECRYFVRDSKPPHGFEHERLMKATGLFETCDGPRDEHDVYVIAADPGVNVKLRKPEQSESSIKLRVCLRQRPDGFELWRTKIDCVLPAPAEVWKDVLATLNVWCDLKWLSSCAEPDQVISGLCKMEPAPFWKRTWKCRWRYSGPQGDVEIAKVTIDSVIDSYYSVSFESRAPDPAGIRAIRDELLTDELGFPTNYVELLRQISPR